METYKKRQSRGPKSLISALVKSLIRKQELSDKEICAYVKSKYPDASTSVKCVQYYRYQLRTDGLIPPAKVNRRKDKIILMWEIIPRANAKFLEGCGPIETFEGTYTGKQLIKKCREIYAYLYDANKTQAYEAIYSVPVCALFLLELGWDCVEIETTVKCKEYVGDDEC